MLAQNNHDLFLLTMNLTRLFEYLPSFDLQRCENFAELYGSVFTSISPQAETTDHQHVQEARDRFAAFINSHQAGRSSMVKIKVLFLGVGMKRNGEGVDKG